MLKKQLKDLIDFAKATDLQEITWEKKGVLIRFERAGLAPAAKAPAAPAPSGAGAAAAARAPEALVIRSTMVGTFYRADSPQRPPLVVEGTQVSSGQAVGSVEAMKIMKDVVAPMDCRIVKALVANGHPVEYGQPLFEVEPLNDPLSPSGERVG